MAAWPDKATLSEMEQAHAADPGIETSSSQPIRDNVLESISQVDGQIVIKVRGDDLDADQRRVGRLSSKTHRQTCRVWRSAFIDRDWRSVPH